jgi:alcohol dehydrogenase (cytochrome c)
MASFLMSKSPRSVARRFAPAQPAMRLHRWTLAASFLSGAKRSCVFAACLLLPAFAAKAQSGGNPPGSPVEVRTQDLESGRLESNWLTFYGDYSGRRYSSLAEITPSNVAQLRLQWAFHIRNGSFAGAGPVVAHGVIYVATSSDVYAIDGRTGAMLWHHTWQNSSESASRPAAPPNPGLAILGHELYVTTDDARLLCLDARLGNQLWEVALTQAKQSIGIPSSPLVVSDMVIVGVTESDASGFVAAFRADDGKEAWRFPTGLAPNTSAPSSGPARPTPNCGGAVWTTGTYDPVAKTIYWEAREASARASNAQPGASQGCLLALDAETGKVKWQAAIAPPGECVNGRPQTPVLIDAAKQGTLRKSIAVANGGGSVSLYDRETGKLLSNAATACGGADTIAASFSTQTHLFYTMSSQKSAPDGDAKRVSTEAAVVAYAPQRQSIAWRSPLQGPGLIAPGLLTTSTGLLFLGDPLPQFEAHDAATGKTLWSFTFGQAAASAPVSFAVEGRQLVMVAAGKDLFAFGLP